MFRRRAAAAPALLDGDQVPEASGQPSKQAGKGRPTPKRSEVERRRRQPYAAPPTDKKTAAAQSRERRRADQQRKMDAMRRGEEWALPPRDRGPVRALARDYVDSRRFVLRKYILFAVLALVPLIVVLGAAKNSSVILYAEIGIVGLIAVESLYYAMRVRRLARQRLPGQSTRGIAWYIAKRSIRLRSTRIPPARVARGEAIR